MTRIVIEAFALTAAFLAGGCQTGRPQSSQLHTDQTGAVSDRTDLVRDFAPDWYREIPATANGIIYESAQGRGATPNMSENLAINQARQEMAVSIESRVDVLQRSFQEQIASSGNLQLTQRFEDVNTIVASKSLLGSHVVRKETLREPEGTYRTFVLMKLDGREIDANLLDAADADEDLEATLRGSAAWAELERRAMELREEQGQTAP